MGQQNSKLKKIEQISKVSITIKHGPGERAFMAPQSREEYVLVTRLYTENQDQIKRLLTKRKELKSPFIPELIEFGRQSQTYCSEIAFMQILFQRPAKSLLEEVNNRRAADEWFDQGQAMMIAYCTLEAMKTYRIMADEYDVLVEETTLFVSNSGMIVLSDTHKYNDRLSHRKQSFRRLDISQNKEKMSLSQLGIVLNNLEKGAKIPYSRGLNQFIEALIRGEISVYQQALDKLHRLKQQSKEIHQKDATVSLVSYCSHKKQNQENNKVLNGTPITKLSNLVDKRSPLRDIDLNENLPKYGNEIQKGSFNQLAHKKQSRCMTYKSQFQTKIAQAVTQDIRIFEEGHTIRLDELSSIVQRGESKQTEGNQHDQSTFLLHDIDKPIEKPIINLPLIPMIDLFSPSRPERLKQLVLNQKGIIYEESGDEVESLASQRTFRIRSLYSQ